VRRSLIAALALIAPSQDAQADGASTRALNALRVENGRAPLAYSQMLQNAATRHADDMARRQFFSHTGSDGSDVAERVTKSGYRWCVVAENIAQGQRSLPEVMEDWYASPPHRQNMMSREVTEFALVQGPEYIWVMVLAATDC
jgi:uncharacterized protein YkwD